MNQYSPHPGEIVQFPATTNTDRPDQSAHVCPEPPCFYRPSAFYFRRQIREAQTLDRAQALGLAVVLELEHLKAWVREHGMIPPRFVATEAEAREKGWNGTDNK